MEFDAKLKIKEEPDYIEDNNENYLKIGFDINVKVEEADVDEDWCIQNLITTNVTESINFVDLKQECLQTCIICLKNFNDSLSLYKHNLTHLIVPLIRRKLYMCNDCLRFYYKKNDLETHIIVSHMVKTIESKVEQYKCELCLKTYNYKSWCRHMTEVHVDLKLNCNICNKTFKSRQTLKRHQMYVHDGVKASWRFHKIKCEPVQCAKCPQMFMNRATLTTHIRNCHDQGVHKCKICDSVLKSRSYLLAHMKRVHYDDGKLHSCGICGNKFKSPRYLNVHIRNCHS